MAGTVFFNHILHDPASTFIIKININIGHTHTIRIQETLKQQIVFNRVYIGDPQTIGYHRTSGRTPTRPNGNIQITGFPNKIFYNQKVARITRFFNNIQFEVNAFFDVLSEFGISFFGSLIGKVPQVRIFPSLAAIFIVFRIFELFRNVKFGKQNITSQFKRFYLIYNFLNVVNSLRNILKEIFHLFRRFKIILLIGQAITIASTTTYRRGLLFAIFNTQQNIMRIGIFLRNIIGIVCCNQFNIVLPGKCYQGLVNPIFIFLPMTHQLNV